MSHVKPRQDGQVPNPPRYEGRASDPAEDTSYLIAIPTYNERENIESLLDEIHDAASGGDILVIDDNSPDGTGVLLDSLAATHSFLHVIHRPGKLGLGTAYVRGFQYAIDNGYDFIFEMDADHSHDPKYLPHILRAAKQADLVIGSRYVPGGGAVNWSSLRRAISSGGNTFARTMLRIPTHDCTSGFRCYSTNALRTVDLALIHARGYAFQVEMAYIFWKRGYRVREVPIIFHDRDAGESKMSPKIVAEALLWVMRTRLRDDPAAQTVPAITTTGTTQLLQG